MFLGHDIHTRASVAIKVMRQRDQFEREIVSRLNRGCTLPNDCVVEILGWHCPRDVPFVNAIGRAQQDEPTDGVALCEQHPYVLVMARGDRSLHQGSSPHFVHETRNLSKQIVLFLSFHSRSGDEPRPARYMCQGTYRGL